MTDEGWSTGKKIVVFGCGGLVLLGLLCAGGLVATGLWVRDKAAELEAMTPEERATWLHGMTGHLSAKWDPTVDRFLAHLHAGEFAEAHAMTSPTLQAKLTEDGLAALQSRIDGALGAHEIRGTRTVHRQVGATNSVTITYEAAYARGGGTMTVSLVEDPSGTGFLIDAYEVDSPLLTDARPDDVEDATGDETEPR